MEPATSTPWPRRSPWRRASRCAWRRIPCAPWTLDCWCFRAWALSAPRGAGRAPGARGGEPRLGLRRPRLRLPIRGPGRGGGLDGARGRSVPRDGAARQGARRAVPSGEELGGRRALRARLPRRGALMKAIPAIDLREGACVQLVGGSYADERVRVKDPVDALERWRAHGFTSFHVVDLDAALGKGSNEDAIRALLAH